MDELRLAKIDNRIDNLTVVLERTTEGIDKINDNMTLLVKLSERQTSLSERHESLEQQLMDLSVKTSHNIRELQEVSSQYRADRQSTWWVMRVLIGVFITAEVILGSLVFRWYSDTKEAIDRIPLIELKTLQLKERIDDLRPAKDQRNPGSR